MKKFKTALAALLAAAALSGLTGCAENAGSTSDPYAARNDGNRGTESLAEVKTEKSTYSPITLTDSNAENSILLFDSISAGKENAMFSPISLNMALGLIEAGADGDTKTALDAYLQTEDFTGFAENYMRLAREKYSSESKYGEWKNVLEIANSIWADHRVPLRDEYRKAMTERLGAEIRNVSFKDKEETLGLINGWVNEKTHKMIPQVLDDYDEKDTAAVLLNTVYFESAWREQWGFMANGEAQPFTLLDGSEKKIPLMINTTDTYFENDKATAFSCGYMNGLEFIGILPKNEGKFTLKDLDIPALLDSRNYDYDVTAVMPALEFKTDLKLADALKAAGLDNIFMESADFSGISEDTFYVTDVVQSTKLELDENGTKAAAATAVVTTDCAEVVTPKEKKTVQLDRPFAFMIYDQAQKQMLFVGKVTNP